MVLCAESGKYNTAEEFNTSIVDFFELISQFAHACVLSGISTTAREEEAAGGLLLFAAGQRNTGKEVCHHPEGADSAGATSGGDKVGGGFRCLKLSY